jgi:sterol desaturase/sphingolipid hydroxylase (fatty acid hydroxylase superfamily)
MNDWILQNELAIRAGFFFAVFIPMALWEIAAPRRPLTDSKGVRWFSNLGIVFLNIVLLRLVLPAGAVGLAWLASERGWGLLNNLELPYAISVILSVAVLDFVIYVQHVLFHAIPALWKLHMVHHADVDFDVTTGTRFHPIEIILSMLIKLLVVAALGPPILGVLIFEVVLNATAMFNHSNVRIPISVDAILRLLVVTPDMHRVHHSVIPVETNSNFGFNLPWWDRLLGTYLAQPEEGHEGMTIGLRHMQGLGRQKLPRMLAIPFLEPPGDYVICRRPPAAAA